MGFCEEISLDASQKYPNNIDNAISWITEQSNQSAAIDDEKCNPSNTSTMVPCTDCNNNNCSSLQRIQRILNIYDEWLYHKHNKDRNFITYILSKSINKYSVRNTLNDYHHIKHKKYNLLESKTCSQSPTNCIPYTRHKRDNHNYQQQYFGSNVSEIVTQRLLDQIHLFMYHKYNIHRLDLNKTGDRTSRFGTIIDEKPRNTEKINDDIYDDNINTEKYKQTVNEFKYENDDSTKEAYNFGQQFFYWKYYQHHAWYINAKYSNFQTELISNDIYCIDKFSWDIEYENAKDKLENDDNVRSIRSNNVFNAKYDINPNIAITINHVIAILFYCNTSELQNKFSATYRRLTFTMESNVDFKKRHSNYFYFGKYLRECVEVFGDVLVDDDLILYHGIDHPLYFTKMIAKFYGPTSTTRKRGVAENFAGNDGMILSFSKYFRNAFYFDCILSGFDQEEECLFIGGYAALRIINIIHFINAREKIENYHKYLNLMEIFFSLINIKNDDEISISSTMMESGGILESILINQMSKRMTDIIPNYIQNLFQFKCDKITVITIDLDHFKQATELLNIHALCMNYERTMLDFALFGQLFPNLTQMVLMVNKTFQFTPQIIAYLHKNLAKKHIVSNHLFKYIEFCFNMKLLLPVITKIINRDILKSNFHKIGWQIDIQRNAEDFESVYFINNAFYDKYSMNVNHEENIEVERMNQIKILNDIYQQTQINNTENILNDEAEFKGLHELFMDNHTNNTEKKENETDDDEEEEEEQSDDESDIMNELSIQLHVWDYTISGWIPLKGALANHLKIAKKRGNKEKSRVMLSKKYGELNGHEIKLYNCMEECCHKYYELQIPHEMLMIILIYSQGYKFDEGDQVIYFPNGIFDDSATGKIKDVILIESAMKNTYQYRIKRDYIGITNRVPLNHVFTRYIVVMDHKLLKKKTNIDARYGDVYFVKELGIRQNEVYSKKKKRKIRKCELTMQICCFHDKSVGVRKSKYFTKDTQYIAYDNNIFTGAKFQRIDV